MSDLKNKNTMNKKHDETPLLRIRGLKYAYSNDKHALNGIDLDIWNGEKLAILGANGAGKSTFFLNLNGVLKADAGSIELDGVKMSQNQKDLNRLRSSIGIVFQDPDNQIIASTVRGEVSFGPMNQEIPVEEVRIRTEAAMKRMDIEQFADRAPHYLSSGEKKRVAIADIIAMHPEIFIFDEPTAALDPASSQMLEGVLDRLSDEGRTIVVSTHDVNFAYRWADRIIVFKDGKIIAQGTPDEIFRNREVLEAANLHEPTLMTVTDHLKSAGLIPESSDNPRSVEAFVRMTKELTALSEKTTDTGVEQSA